MIKQIIFNRLGDILSKPIPRSSRKDIELSSKLKSTFRKLPLNKTKNLSPSEASWAKNMNRLRELVLECDPRGFLRWDVILSTMFVSYEEYVSTELKFLQKSPYWNNRWRSAIKESYMGRPIPYFFYPCTSGNLIHHAYHLAQFEEKTNMQLKNIEIIFEFGGGYGSMCRLFHNLGFNGIYILFDQVPFSALQKYYLASLGFHIHSATSFRKLERGIVCISDIHDLEAVITRYKNTKNTMFIATWSISETSRHLRNSILSLVSDFKSFLITYQDRFGEVDNRSYFNRFMRANKKVEWYNWDIKHIPGNRYLVGVSH